MTQMTPGADATNRQTQRIAVAFPRRAEASPHELASQHCLARRLASLLELEFIENYDPVIRQSVGSVYYVPAHTLVGAPTTGAPDECLADIRGHHDLFGGVVPHAFVATKAITHSLFDSGSSAPNGWSKEFGERVRSVVLNGATVFSTDEARRAGAALLRNGPMRVKPVNGVGGRGQSLVENHSALDIAIEGQNAAELSQCGLVLEEHLEDVCTYSVGHVSVGSLVSTYVGTQSLTRDNAGEMVYGGSNLLFVRGGYEALLAADISIAERKAVQLARVYDAAALHCFPGLYASRRNYDVAQGKDSQGRIRAGVLEQSWRAGGASMAEAWALEAFQIMPDTHILRAFTCERYGANQPPPSSTQLIYQGDDPKIGFITKYGGVSSYGNT